MKAAFADLTLALYPCAPPTAAYEFSPDVYAEAPRRINQRVSLQVRHTEDRLDRGKPTHMQMVADHAASEFAPGAS